MPEILINKKNSIQYRTYRNDYNRDKNNRRNNYRSNTGYGGEQQRYCRNSRQGNSKNVIFFQQGNSNHQSNESAEIRDALVKVLPSINCRTLSTETIIVTETQDNGRMNSFLVTSLSQERQAIMKMSIKLVKSTENNKKLHKL